MGTDKEKRKKDKKEKSKKERKEKGKRKRSRKHRDESPEPAAVQPKKRSRSRVRHISPPPSQAQRKDEGHSPRRHRRPEVQEKRSPLVPALPAVPIRATASPPQPLPLQREPLEEHPVHLDQHQSTRTVGSPPKRVTPAQDLQQSRDGRQRGLPAKEQQPPRERTQLGSERGNVPTQQAARKRLRPAEPWGLVRQGLGSLLRPHGPGPARRQEETRHAGPTRASAVPARLASRLARPVQATPQETPPASPHSQRPSSAQATTAPPTAAPRQSRGEGTPREPPPGLTKASAVNRGGPAPALAPPEKPVARPASEKVPDMSHASEEVAPVRSSREGAGPAAAPAAAAAAPSAKPKGRNMSELNEQIALVKSQLAEHERALASRSMGSQGSGPKPTQERPPKPDGLRHNSGLHAEIQNRKRSGSPAAAVAEAMRPAKAARGSSTVTAALLQVAGRRTETMPPRLPRPQSNGPLAGDKPVGLDSARGVQPSMKSGELAGSSRVSVQAPAGQVSAGPPRQVPASAQHPLASGIKSLEDIRKEKARRSASPSCSDAAPSAAERVRARLPAAIATLQGPLPRQSAVECGVKRRGSPISYAPNANGTSVSTAPSAPPDGSSRPRIPIPPPRKGPPAHPSASVGPSTAHGSKPTVSVPHHPQRPAAAHGGALPTPSAASAVPVLPAASSPQNAEAAGAKPITGSSTGTGSPPLKAHVGAAGQAANGGEVKPGDAEEGVGMRAGEKGASLGNSALATPQVGGGSTAGPPTRFVRKAPPSKKPEEPPVPYEHKCMTVMKGGDALEIRYYMHVPTGPLERLRLRKLRQEAEDRAKAEQAQQAVADAAPASNSIANGNTASAAQKGTASGPVGTATGHSAPAENGAKPETEGGVDRGASDPAKDPAGLVKSGALQEKPEGGAVAALGAEEAETTGADAKDLSAGRGVHPTVEAGPANGSPQQEGVVDGGPVDGRYGGLDNAYQDLDRKNLAALNAEGPNDTISPSETQSGPLIATPSDGVPTGLTLGGKGWGDGALELGLATGVTVEGMHEEHAGAGKGGVDPSAVAE